jgi:microcin C transport system substrate-binding protein
MQAWVMNLRREKFQDVRVRQALNLAFDFEWSNQNLFYGLYARTRSFFGNSELEAKGLPSADELEILNPLKHQLPAEVFTTEYTNPTNTTSADRRRNLRAAQALLTQAGWKSENQNGKRILKNAKGESFTIEFLLYSPIWERVALPYKEQLEILGFEVSIRTVDLSQYQQRSEEFDFDMNVGSWGQSLSPGNEQRELWGSPLADKKGSRNTSGIKNPAIDAIIDKIILAQDRKSLVSATQALDRALIWNHYVVPMWFNSEVWLAHWKRIAFKDPLPGYAVTQPLSVFTPVMWFDENANAEIKKN